MNLYILFFVAIVFGKRLFSKLFFLIISNFLESSSAYICPTQYGFYRNPANAHQFYECVNGKEFLYDCPANLVFNEAKQVCDYDVGPVVVHTTPAPLTPKHGTRHRHTVEPVTEPVVTVEHQPTTNTVEHHNTEPEFDRISTSLPHHTRGRHH